MYQQEPLKALNRERELSHQCGFGADGLVGRGLNRPCLPFVHGVLPNSRQGECGRKVGMESTGMG